MVACAYLTLVGAFGSGRRFEGADESRHIGDVFVRLVSGRPAESTARVVAFLSSTAVSDLPEGCVSVGVRNARFFIFSDRLLTILVTKLLRMRLKSPFSYTYRTVIYVHAIYHRQNLNFLKIVSPGRWKKVSKTW